MPTLNPVTLLLAPYLTYHTSKFCRHGPGKPGARHRLWPYVFCLHPRYYTPNYNEDCDRAELFAWRVWVETERFCAMIPEDALVPRPTYRRLIEWQVADRLRQRHP